MKLKQTTPPIPILKGDETVYYSVVGKYIRFQWQEDGTNCYSLEKI